MFTGPFFSSSQLSKVAPRLGEELVPKSGHYEGLLFRLACKGILHAVIISVCSFGQLSCCDLKTLFHCLHPSPLAFTLCPHSNNALWAFRKGFCCRYSCCLQGWTLCILEISESSLVLKLHVIYHLLQTETSLVIIGRWF